MMLSNFSCKLPGQAKFIAYFSKTWTKNICKLPSLPHNMSLPLQFRRCESHPSLCPLPQRKASHLYSTIYRQVQPSKSLPQQASQPISDADYNFAQLFRPRALTIICEFFRFNEQIFYIHLNFHLPFHLSKKFFQQVTIDKIFFFIHFFEIISLYLQ